MHTANQSGKLHKEVHKNPAQTLSPTQPVPAVSPTYLIQRLQRSRAALSATDVLHLQRQIGNRAVARLLGKTQNESAFHQPEARSTDTITRDAGRIQRQTQLGQAANQTHTTPATHVAKPSPTKLSNVIQLLPEWAIVKKREGRNKKRDVATHKFRQTKKGVEVRSGGMLNTGVEDRLAEGHQVTVDLERLDNSGRFAYVTYNNQGGGKTGLYKEAYINKYNVELVKDLPETERVASEHKQVKKIKDPETLKELGPKDINVATNIDVENRKKVITLEMQHLMQYQETNPKKTYFSATPAKYIESIREDGLRTSYGGSGSGSVTSDLNVGRYNSRNHIYMFTYEQGAKVYGETNVEKPFAIVAFTLSKDQIITVDPESGDVTTAVRTDEDIPPENIVDIQVVKEGKKPKNL